MASVGLVAESISKSYARNAALVGVSFDLLPGEIHALCGENGAGKSTLIRIIGGALRADAGRVRAGGAPIPPGSVRDAESAGIVVVHQEPLAFPDLSAEDCIFVGHEPCRGGGLWLDRAAMRRETRALLDQLGERFDTRVPVGALTLAQRQMVALARALSRRCRYLILDEPTASLSSRETAALLALVRRLAAQGVGVLYVSHRLEEIFELAQRQVSVLRDGRLVETVAREQLTRDRLIRLMVGRELAVQPTPVSTAPVGGEPVLDVRNLTRAGEFEDVSLTVRAGEIVGLAGLVGAGRSELLRAVSGVDRWDSGSVRVAGRVLRGGSVRGTLDRGLALVPEDRRLEGLVLPLAVGANLALAVLRRLCSAGFVSAARERGLGQRFVGELGVRTAGLDAPTATLSGGNQQKVLLGKWLATAPRVLLLDEPTRGVDVGAKDEIHALIRRLAADGMAVLLVSSELPEILALSHRIHVMREGVLVGELPRELATQEAILSLAVPASDTAEASA